MKLKLFEIIIITTIILAAILVLVGNLLLLRDTMLSQVLGYLGFILFLISFIIYFLTRNLSTRFLGNEEFTSKPIMKHNNLKFVILNIVASLILILTAERNLLFSNSIVGLFIPNPALIRDSLTPFSLVTGYTGSGQGFIVQSFFMNWESFLPLSASQYDKIAILSMLFFYYFIAALVSRTLYRVLGLKSIPEALFSVLFASFFLFNFIYYSTGYGSFIIGPLMITYATIKIYEALKNDSYKLLDGLRIGLAISFAIFGDPRSLVYFVLILLGFLIGILAKYRYRLIRFLKFSASTFLIIIPMFAVMYTMTSFVPVFVANAGRAGNYNTIAFFSSATKPMFIWDFLANWWSGFVASPPSIIAVSRDSINYLPTIYAGNAILVYNINSINFIWLISLSILSILAIVSIIFLINDRRNARFSILYIPFFILFALTLGSNIGFRPFVDFIASLSTIPVIGSLWAVTVSTPQWIDPYFSSFLIIFASYSLLRIAETIGTMEFHTKKHKININHKKFRSYAKYCFVFVVLLLFLFANWQFFDQGYALGQELPGNLPGNQVSSTPPMVPVEPPKGWLSAYDSLYNPSNQNYSVYTNEGSLIPLVWDNGSNSFSTPGIPPNSFFSGILNKAVALNMSYLIPTIFNAYGVKYFFFDKTQLHPDWTMYNALLTSGLKVVSTNSNFTIFESMNATEIQKSPFSVYLNSTSELGTIEILNMFNSYGINPVIINHGIGNLNITGSNFLSNAKSGIFYNSTELANDFPAFQFDDFKGSYSGSSNGDTFSVGNDWNITRYYGIYYVNYTVNNNSIEVQKYDGDTGKSPGSIFNLYYGNGSIPIPSGDSVVLHYNFTYSSNQNGGQIQFYGAQNNIHLQTNVKNKTAEGTFVESAGNPSFQFGWALDKYNGSLKISNVNITYSYQKNGMVHTSSFSQTIHAVPDRNYTILYTILNKSGQACVGMKSIFSSPTGDLNYTLSGFQYLGGVAIIPLKYLTETATVNNIKMSISNGGSSITVFNNLYAEYIVNSYNPDYHWQTSKNLKFLGTNQLGQQVFQVNTTGNITFVISSVEDYKLMDWSVAIAMNIIIPFFLFVPVGYYVKFRRLKKLKNIFLSK